MIRPTVTFAAALLLAACATKQNEEPAGDSAANAPPAPAASAPAAADPDAPVGGQGVPAGFLGRTDRESANITEAKYVPSAGRWEVTTGPAHILWAARDTVSGDFTAGATIDQLEKPKHPEAFGLFIGGRNLDEAMQQYTYFLVRGGGEYLIKVREGGTTREIAGWTKHDAIPVENAEGKATYRLAIRVKDGKVGFLVNDREVRSVPAKDVPTAGIAGLRINHNLHLLVGPIAISK